MYSKWRKSILFFIAMMTVGLFISSAIVAKEIPVRQTTSDEPSSDESYGNKSVSPVMEDRDPPHIQAPNLIVAAGKKVNLSEFVRAADNVDGDLTNRVIVSPFSTDRPGVQTLELKVADSSGNISKKTVTLIIKEPIHTKKQELPGQKLAKANTTPNRFGDPEKQAKKATHSQTPLNKKIIRPAPRKAAASHSKPSPSSKSSDPSSQSSGTYSPMTIYFNGKAVPYVNGGKNGQKMINSGWRASTWGGAPVFSGTDGLNTHFIGHNPGPFEGIWTAKDIIITDRNGTPFRYRVTRVYKVNDQAVGISDKKNYWERITGKGGGERITLQTCYNDEINWIVEAQKK